MNMLSKWCASGYTPEPPIIGWCPLVNLSHNMSQSLGLSSRNSWLESLKTKTIHDYFGVLPDWFEDTLHVNLNIPGPSLTSKNEGYLKAQTSGVSSLLFWVLYFEGWDRHLAFLKSHIAFILAGWIITLVGQGMSSRISQQINRVAGQEEVKAKIKWLGSGFLIFAAASFIQPSKNG